jgi:hypothetical protein
VSRRPAAVLPAVLLLAALVGCDATPAGRHSDTVASPTDAVTATPGPAVPSPAGSTAGSIRPAPAYDTIRPPTEPPGRLAGATLGGPGGWVARLWFGGVPVARVGDRPVVAYAAVELDSDGTRTAAHAKLALFHCLRRQAAGSPNFVGCTGRQVEYGDLTPSQLRVEMTGAGAFTVSGSFPTYAYRGAVDRGTGLSVRWTGRMFPLRVTCAPDPEPVCRPGRPGRTAASAAVILGRNAVAGRSGLDFGYLNRLTR